jgi:hypothetical protein
MRFKPPYIKAIPFHYRRKVPEPEGVPEQLDRLRRELVQTVLDPGYKPSPDEQEMWVKHVATLGHKVGQVKG